jgi:hypothetical protein
VINHFKKNKESKEKQKPLQGKIVEINFRDLEVIEPLGLKNYNPLDYQNTTRSDFWFVFDNIKNITSDPKLGIVLLFRDQLRKQSEIFIAKYSKSSLSEIIVMRQYYKTRANQADKAIIKWLPEFLCLFGRRSKVTLPNNEVRDNRVYSTGGWLALRKIQLFVNAMNHENLSLMIVQGLSRLLDRDIILNDNSKRKGSSRKNSGKADMRHIYDEYRIIYDQKYQEKKRQTEEYGARRYAAEETVKMIWKEKRIKVEVRNLLDAMRRR